MHIVGALRPYEAVLAIRNMAAPTPTTHDETVLARLYLLWLHLHLQAHYEAVLERLRASAPASEPRYAPPPTPNGAAAAARTSGAAPPPRLGTSSAAADAVDAAEV